VQHAILSSVGARTGGLGRAARGANTDTHAAPDETHAAAGGRRGRLARARATMPTPATDATTDMRREGRGEAESVREDR
jgi:hypothetical protein